MNKIILIGDTDGENKSILKSMGVLCTWKLQDIGAYNYHL